MALKEEFTVESVAGQQWMKVALSPANRGGRRCKEKRVVLNDKVRWVAERGVSGGK